MSLKIYVSQDDTRNHSSLRVGQENDVGAGTGVPAGIWILLPVNLYRSEQVIYFVKESMIFSNAFEGDKR